VAFEPVHANKQEEGLSMKQLISSLVIDKHGMSRTEYWLAFAGHERKFGTGIESLLDIILARVRSTSHLDAIWVSRSARDIFKAFEYI
jgi:hypothetical protein